MDGEGNGAGSTVKSSYSVRVMAVLLLLAFIGGIVAMGWISARWQGWQSWQTQNQPSDAEPAPDSAPTAPGERTNGKAASPAPAHDDANRDEVLRARVSDLEDRIARINLQAEAASGNAARAEGLLIAFAARRALDGGAPLGYLEGQLRLRFGQAQPRAVATIINAAREPVTLQDLQANLEDIGPQLVGHGASSNWWADVRQQVGELIVFRKADTPSPLPERRLARAGRYLEAGRVAPALAEVTRMPGREAGEKWMEQARRYIEARRALDVIETAAILEPHQLRATDGGTVDQPSPLNP